jgi:hypothetical protein
MSESTAMLDIVKQPWRLLYHLTSHPTGVCGVIRFDLPSQQEVIVSLPLLVQMFQQHILSYNSLNDRLHQYKLLCHYNPTYLDTIFKNALEAILCFDT